jgi:hypothetical protein
LYLLEQAVSIWFPSWKSSGIVVSLMITDPELKHQNIAEFPGLSTFEVG